MILHLNMRLMPTDRENLFEGPLGEALRACGIGEVDGGETLRSPEGMPLSCDVDLVVDPEKEAELVAFLVRLDSIAVGSYLEVGSEQVPLGTLEGLCLALDGVGLPDEVYEQADSNALVDELDDRLGDAGFYASYYIGPKYTNLYFYGDSYEEMEEAVRAYARTCPQCAQCIIGQV